MKRYIAKNSLELFFCLILICLFNFPKFAPISLVLTIAWVIVAAIRKQLVFAPNYTALGFVLLYIAYAVGVIWTQDIRQSTFYLENKLSFVLIPLLFSFSKKSGFNISIVFKGLIISVLIAFFWGVAKGIPCYLHYYSFPWCFLKSHLSQTIHPTYMTVGATISIIATLFLMQQKQLNRKWGITAILLLSVYIFLLLSLSGVLFFMLFLGIYFFAKITKGKSKCFIFITCFSLAGVFAGIMIFSPFLKKDIAEAEKNLVSFFSSQEQFIENLPEIPSSSQVRLILWAASFEEIKQHPMGVGTGNVDIYLGNNLREKGLNELASHNYNPHSQFLQTTLEIGLIGLAILIFIIASGIRWGVKTKNLLIILLFINLAFNSLFESMLQQQSGIIFYPLFLMILHIYTTSEKRIHG